MNTPTKLMYQGITWNYVGTSPPKNPKVGDIYYDGGGIKIYNGTSTTWITTSNTIDTTYYPTTPKIKYPKNCINCGATLHSYKCEYCDTEY